MERFDLIISRQLLGDRSGPGRSLSVWQDECKAYQKGTEWCGSGNAGIYGRLVSPDGTLDGSSYAIASASQAARPPAPESESHPWCCGFSRPAPPLESESHPWCCGFSRPAPPLESASHPCSCGFSRPAPTHQNPTHAIAPSEETLPRLSADGGWSPVVWQRANTGGTGDDRYGRRLWAGGRPAAGEPAFAPVEAAANHDGPAVAGDGTGGCPLATLRRRLVAAQAGRLKSQLHPFCLVGREIGCRRAWAGR